MCKAVGVAKTSKALRKRLTSDKMEWMCSFHGSDGDLQGLSESIAFSGDLPDLHRQGKPSFRSYFSVRRVNVMGTESR